MGVGLGQGKKAEPRLGRRWRQLTIAAASLDNDFGAKLGRGEEQLAPQTAPEKCEPSATVPFHQCLCTLCTTTDTDTARSNRARLRCLSRRTRGLPVHGLPTMRRGCAAAILCLLACACASDDPVPRKARGGKRGHGRGSSDGPGSSGGAAHEDHGAGVRAGAARHAGGGAPRFGRRSDAAKKRHINAKQGEQRAEGEVPDKASNARRAKRMAKRRSRRDAARRDARRDARRTARHAARTA